MLFKNAAFFSVLLFLLQAIKVHCFPRDIDVRSSEITTSTLDTRASARTPCNPNECNWGRCKPPTSLTGRSPIGKTLIARSGANNVKRFLNGPISYLAKRFFEAPISEFVNQLWGEAYNHDISDGNSFLWHPFTNDAEYSTTIIGLCGCTGIIGASTTGMFSAHLFEEGAMEGDPDLQPANYQALMTRLSTALTPYRGALVGGQVWLVMPTKEADAPGGGGAGTQLYDPEIVQAIRTTVQQASGLLPNIFWYIPLDCALTNPWFERGTMAGQYDPAWTDPATGKHGPAYKLWSEQSTPLATQQW